MLRWLYIYVFSFIMQNLTTANQVSYAFFTIQTHVIINIHLDLAFTEIGWTDYFRRNSVLWCLSRYHQNGKASISTRRRPGHWRTIPGSRKGRAAGFTISLQVFPCQKRRPPYVNRSPLQSNRGATRPWQLVRCPELVICSRRGAGAWRGEIERTGGSHSSNRRANKHSSHPSTSSSFP
jgi:hypothetical protein